VCARLVVNQNNGLETEQVATVCCGFMCAHCAAEHFMASLHVFNRTDDMLTDQDGIDGVPGC